MAPPRESSTSSNAPRASRNSCCGSKAIAGRAVPPPAGFFASVTNGEKRTSRACGGDCGPASMARWRYSTARSRYRWAAPRAHLQTAARDTSCASATTVTKAPCPSPATAAKMFSTLLVFPGRTSQGRMRSRALQALQRPSLTRILPYPSMVCRPRSTQLLVRTIPVPAHTAQVHPARMSSSALARTGPYRVECMSSTCVTTYLVDGPYE